MLTRFSDTPIKLEQSLPVVSLELPSSTTTVIRKSSLGYQSLLRSKEEDSSENLLIRFESGLTSYGKILDIKSECIFQQLSLRVLRDQKTIVFTPLALSNNFGYKYQTLSFKFPGKIQNRCVTISESFEAKDLTVTVDVLLTNNVLVTLLLRPQFFIQDEFDVTTSSFYQWCGYSQPYSFDLRPPLFSYSSSSQTVVFVLKDGGILRLDRDDALSTTQLVQPFSDTSYLKALKSKWFGKSTISLPENVDPSHTAIENVSTASQISCLVHDDFMITLSIDKILRVWSLHSNSVLIEKSLNDELSQDLWGLHLNVSPSDLVTLLPNAEDGYNIALYLPLAQQGLFKVYSLNLQRDNLTSRVVGAEVGPLLMDTNLESANLTSSDTWLFHSSQVVKTSLSGQKLRVFVAWVFNNSRLIQVFDVNLKVSSILSYEVASNDNIEDLLDTHESFETEEAIDSFYSRKLRVKFDQNILTTVIPVFEQRHNLDLLENGQTSVELSSSSDSLSISLIRLIKRSVVKDQNALYLSNLKSQWRRFYSICTELSKKTQQVVVFSMNTGGKFGLLMKSQDYSVIKSAMCFEIMKYSNKIVLRDLPGGVTSQAVEEMVRLLHAFGSSFSSDTLKAVKLGLMNDYTSEASTSWEERMNSIFESSMSAHVTQEVGNALLEGLGKVDNVLQVIEYITTAPQVHLGGFRPIKNTPIGEYGISTLVASVETQIELQSELIFQLLLIVLSVDVNDAMVKIYSKLLKFYAKCHLALATLRLGFKENGELEEDDVLKPSQLMFTAIIKRLNDDGVLVTSSKMNKVTEYFVDFVIYQEEYAFAAVSWLLKANQAGVILNDFVQFLPKESPVSALLEGLIYMEVGEGTKAFEVLRKNSSSIAKYSTTILETRSLEPIQNLSKFKLLGVGSETLYFINLANLFDENGLTNIALKLSLSSITCPHTDDELIKYGHNQQWQFFKLSLKTTEFQMAYHAILNINRKYRSECLQMFILKLFETDQANLLTSFSNADDIDTVHKIIYDLAESSPVLESLKYYKVCYSWRVNYGDYRGACESLYRFISRIQDRRSNAVSTQKLSKNNIILAELYLIIMNLLCTLSEEDDRWILSFALKAGEPNRLKSLAELKTEYKAVLRSMKEVLP
ncbi:unnamed protein product [Kuraishia capsulata CBS 1993]|uniref:Uncharacterized protein n=1 Tax=Kuraishia capsulata CBS 1993 TaxID=1382522 RepID=W6MH31_9ASCO|nr:uncharacterized protein KUCA_T00000915001 [Kuraishia capsulata CBS 1993]CDK24948.1 unnamed protein product [Kuraishia capsulata CBS 1993]